MEILNNRQKEELINGMDEISHFLSLKYTSSKNKENSLLPQSDHMFCREEVVDNLVNNYGKENNDSYFMKGKNNFQAERDSAHPKELSLGHETTFVSKNPESSETSNAQSLSYDNDVMFQNWVDDVVQKESQTDKYLEELKKEHGLTNYNLTDNSKIVSSLSWADEDKIPNISEIDLDCLFMHPSEQIQSIGARKQTVINENKVENSVNIKKNQKQSPSSNKPKDKNISKSDSVEKKYDQTACDKDVDSWISESARTLSHNKRHKSAYFDILKNLEEMETQTGSESNEYKKDLQQHDALGKCSRSESIDDIVSILEVLENENKKSRE